MGMNIWYFSILSLLYLYFSYFHFIFVSDIDFVYNHHPCIYGFVSIVVFLLKYMPCLTVIRPRYIRLRNKSYRNGHMGAIASICWWESALFYVLCYYPLLFDEGIGHLGYDKKIKFSFYLEYFSIFAML